MVTEILVEQIRNSKSLEHFLKKGEIKANIRAYTAKINSTFSLDCKTLDSATCDMCVDSVSKQGPKPLRLSIE